MQNFQQLFEQHTTHFEHLPEWVEKTLRTPGKEIFVKTGLPTRKHEDWKYTNVSHVGKTTYRLAEKLNTAPTDLISSYKLENAYNLVLLNGFLDESLSDNFNSLKDKAVVLTLGEALKRFPEKTQELILNHRKKTLKGFHALNLAFLGQGLFIEVRKDESLDKPINVIYLNQNKADAESACFAHNVVSLEKGAHAEICQSFIGDDSGYFVNNLTHVSLDESSTLSLTHLQSESRSAYHVSKTTADQKKDSQFFHFNLNVGAKLSRHDIDVELLESGAECTLNGLYLSEGDQHVDNHLNVEHRAAHTHSSQTYKGIMGGQSRAVFDGRIHVEQNAQQITAHQLNKNLLLSNDAEIDTKPQLEIDADDVKCSHGATVSQLNDDHVFYLQTRAISKEEAKKLLCKAFGDDVVLSIKNKVVRDLFHTKHVGKILGMAK